MSLKEYLKSKISVIFINLISLITLVVFLFSIGNTFESIKVIVISWIMVLILFFTFEYKKRNAYFNEVFKCTENLDKKYYGY